MLQNIKKGSDEMVKIVSELSDIDNLVINYDFDSEISESTKETFLRPVSSDDEKLTKIGNIGKEMIVRLMKFSGIIEISITPYSLTVRVGKLFDRSELNEKILKELKSISCVYYRSRK